MTRRFLLVLAPLLLAFGIGCGGSSPVPLSAYDLEVMALPADELSAVGWELSADPEPGLRSNQATADASVDPDDTRESVAAAGRVSGYALVYTSEQGLVATRVDLWHDSAAASRGLAKMLADLERFQGQQIGEAVISSFERFQTAPVRDEAGGIRIHSVISGERVFQTSAYFRIGRVVGFATLVRDSETNDSHLTSDLAEKLALRVQAVLERRLRPPMVRIALELDAVRSLTGLALTDLVRHEGDLSQIFEHADLSRLADSAVIEYRGEGSYVSIDLARFGSRSAAKNVYERMKSDELERPDSTGRKLTFKRLGERSTGRVYPPSPANEFVTTVVVAQIGQVVIVVSVLSNDASGLERQVEDVARAQAAEIIASGASR